MKLFPLPKRASSLVVAAFALLGLWSGSAEATDPSYFRDVVCKNYVYLVHSLNDSKVCAETPLSTNERENFLKSIHKFEQTYPGFVQQYSKYYIWNKFKTSPTFVVISDEQMNDGSIFEKNEYFVDGRYFQSKNIVYIRRQSLKEGSPDLPHELAHVANNEIGVSDNRLDEQMAYAFETLFLKQ